MPKVYCKYCDSYASLEVEGGLYVCSNCGCGLAPVEEVRKHGSYRKFKECTDVRFAVMVEALEWYRKQGVEKREEEVYPECPHGKKRNLYGLPLIVELRRNVGLPDNPEFMKKLAGRSK